MVLNLVVSISPHFTELATAFGNAGHSCLKILGSLRSVILYTGFHFSFPITSFQTFFHIFILWDPTIKCLNCSRLGYRPRCHSVLLGTQNYTFSYRLCTVMCLIMTFQFTTDCIYHDGIPTA